MINKPSRKELVDSHSLYNRDSDYQAVLRHIQSLYREKYISKMFKKYGNLLCDHDAYENYKNFLTEKTKYIAFYEEKNKSKNKKLIKPDRFYENLLSSQPMCFNLFGELYFNLKKLSEIFSIILNLPNFEVTFAEFENKPEDKYSTFIKRDNSASDFFIRGRTKTGNAIICIETKYNENLELSVNEAEKENHYKKNHKAYYDAVLKTKYFLRNGISFEEIPGDLFQFFRNDIMAFSQKQGNDTVYSIIIFPDINKSCKNKCEEYMKYINPETQYYMSITLENFVSVIKSCTSENWINDFEKRYLSYSSYYSSDD